MTNAAISSLIQSGTKLFLDSIDPELVKQNLAWGAVGATSNPIIVSGLIETGRFDTQLDQLLEAGQDDSQIAWALTDQLVRQAQEAFHPVWKQTGGNAGWVSFELDPLIEDAEANLPHAERVERYIELGRRWSAGHDN
ncbi:MAG: transaldolase, partial [Planctomycetales bacterium]|nr:transaldolase [Planctomycetales bacterium]